MMIKPIEVSHVDDQTHGDAVISDDVGSDYVLAYNYVQ